MPHERVTNKGNGRNDNAENINIIMGVLNLFKGKAPKEEKKEEEEEEEQQQQQQQQQEQEQEQEAATNLYFL